MGIVPEEMPKEEPKMISKAEVLKQKVHQARGREKRIVPQGMTYGEYMEHLKAKRKELEERR